MSRIGNEVGVRPVANTSVENRPTSQTLAGECSTDHQQRFEKALNCVDSNLAKRGRNQRDWDAPCSEIDAAALGHSAAWGAVSGGTLAAAGAAKPGVPPQGIAAIVAVSAVAGAAIGLGQAVTDPDNIASVNPADHFSENPFQESEREEANSP